MFWCLIRRLHYTFLVAAILTGASSINELEIEVGLSTTMLATLVELWWEVILMVVLLVGLLTIFNFGIEGVGQSSE